MPHAPTNSNLNHKTDTAQAFSTGSDAAGSVQSLGTTAKAAAWQENPDWSADLEWVWRCRTADERKRLEARRRAQLRAAREAEGGERVKLLRSAEWADHRARALALARADVVDTCGKRWRTVACGCSRKELKVGCDQPLLCPRCAARHWRKWRHRITRSLRIHVGASRAAWARDQHRRGMLPGVYLITLTGPHSGDIEADRKRMGEAWRSLSKVANAGRWWSAYALTWEVTPGDDGQGHVHAHVAVVSSWVPYEQLHEAWSHCMPGACVLDVQAPNRARNQAGSAANYLAKYVTKGVDPREMTGRKAGELLCAFRGRRKVTTSRRFWMDDRKGCPGCGQQWCSVGSPSSLQDIAPGAVLRSMAERAGWFIPRGGVQIHLRPPRADVPIPGVVGEPKERKRTRPRAVSH